MKPSALFVFIGCCFASIQSFAQTPKQVELDLLKSLGNIDQFRRPGLDSGVMDTNYDINSLSKANSLFVNKLKYYNKRSPVILTQAIRIMGVAISDDDLFWILSWDTGMGGTNHVYENAIQYRSGGKFTLITDALNDRKHYVYYYDKMYTLNIQGKKFYLSTYYGVFDLHSRGEGIKIFSIENGRLNTRINLIKTNSGFTNKLYYSYYQTDNNLDEMVDTTIEYDPETNTIVFPVVDDSGQTTDRSITYKFTGKYFEKVKN